MMIEQYIMLGLIICIILVSFFLIHIIHIFSKEVTKEYSDDE